jgi:hypothetical protein
LSIEIVWDELLDGGVPGRHVWEMLRFMVPYGLMGALLVGLLAAGSASASIVKGLELPELVESADRIVLGRVVFSESFQRSDGTLATWHRVEIERDIRGNSGEDREVIVETLGGHIGEIAMRVEGEPSFVVGERVVVFIRGGGPYSAFRPVGMAQGVMRVRVEQGEEVVRQSREGLMLVRRNTQGNLEKSLGALPQEERLETFLARVRDLVARDAGDSRE